MKRCFCCLFIVLAFAQSGEAQTKFLVRFKDKGTSPYSLSNPLSYLSQRAIDRRARYSIAIDSTDLPVTPRYIDSIRLSGSVTILNASKWLNSVSIQTSDANALAKINSFPFVQAVAGIATRTNSTNGPGKFRQADHAPALREAGLQSNVFNYGLSLGQIHIHNGEFLHNIGLRGQNMVIGILDGGFLNYLTLSAFDSVRMNGQILGTWDFVARESSVNEDHPHGMECFSIIAGNIPAQF